MFSGGEDGLDSGVDHGVLVAVDPCGRGPFGEAVGVDAAGPAAGQEVVVVISADQSQIVQIRQPTIQPLANVVPLAVLRLVRTAGEEVAPSLAISARVCGRLAIRRLRPRSSTAPVR